MTKLDNLTNSFSSKLNISSDIQLKSHHFDNEQASELDFETVLQNDNTRKLFSMYLKQFNNSCDNLLTLYLICRCFQNPQRIEDRQRIKQILEKTYNTCFIKNELTALNGDLKQKIGESLKKKTYNESIFTAVKSELKLLLETHYFPQFLESDFYKQNIQLMDSLLNKQSAPQESEKCEKLSDKHSTSLISLDSEKKSLKKSTNKGSSSFFAMPNVPKTKTSTSSRMLKQSKSSSSSTSSVASVSSTSKASSKILKNNNAKSASKSSLSTLENSSKLTRQGHHKSNTSINSLNFPPNPYQVVTKAIPVSTQDSERQSVISADENCYRASSLHGTRLPKLHKNIKESLVANKNANVNLPELKAENATQPMKKPTESKAQLPLSESNPQEFFNILSEKLEAYLAQKNHSKQSVPPSNKSRNNHTHSDMTELSFRDNFEQLAVPYESDIDAQLDEHLSRVYNTENLNTSKMSFVKVSSLSRSKQDRSLNISCISNVLPNGHSESNPLNSTLKQHHFYKLTSTSKEVDIDDTNQSNNRNENNYQTHQSKKSGSSRNKETRKSSSQSTHYNPLDNCDSGVSIRSAASIERVNDWLNQTSNQSSAIEDLKKTNKPVSIPDKKIEPPPPFKKEETCNTKTTVAYYLPGEELAYISQFNGENLTLAQFKQLITKKGQFRYFFKTKSDLLDEECIVYQEATDDCSTVPMFNDKVIAKIEKS